MTGFLKEIGSYFEAGGFVMPYLLLVCIALWTLIIERWLYLYAPVKLFRGWSQAGMKREMLAFESAAAGFVKGDRSKKASDDLHAMCARSNSEVAGFIHRALLENDSSTPDSLALSLDEAEHAYSMKIRRGISILGMLSSVAPMLGLLGTVSGMIEAFHAMMISGGADARSLSGGISAALITTQVGLVVALPGLFCRSLFFRRAESLEGDMRLLSTRVRCAGQACAARPAGGAAC